MRTELDGIAENNYARKLGKAEAARETGKEPDGALFHARTALLDGSWEAGLLVGGNERHQRNWLQAYAVTGNANVP